VNVRHRPIRVFSMRTISTVVTVEPEVNVLKTFFTNNKFHVGVNYHTGSNGLGYCVLPPKGVTAKGSSVNARNLVWNAVCQACTENGIAKCEGPFSLVADNGCGSMDMHQSDIHDTIAFTVEAAPVITTDGKRVNGGHYSPIPNQVTQTDWERYHHINRQMLFIASVYFKASDGADQIP